VQECFYNDRTAEAAIAKAMMALPIIEQYQWPLTRGVNAVSNILVPSQAHHLIGTSHIEALGLGGTNNRAIWLWGAHFIQGAKVALFSGTWQPPGSLRSVTPAQNDGRLITIGIPDDIYAAYPSLNVVVTYGGGWSDPRYIQIR
jgi:hypothetical protein